MRLKLEQIRRMDLVLICTTLLAAFLNIFNIWKDQYSNSYYTAAVTSMLQSWHNFFYASFDPAGFVTVDKPPVSLWVQTIFAYIFGVHGWSVILPEALAGIGSVLLIYYLVKPTFGKTSARLASLIMACTPIAVAVNRTNNVDSLLVFTLMLATWMLFRAIKRQKLSWAVGAFALIGLGFNIKMLQAYMVLPAFYLFYLLAFKSGWKKKLAILLAATVIMVGASISWAVVVDSTSKDSRPYIGSSQTNSVLELAFGYNGIQRLTGRSGGQQKQNGNNMPAPQGAGQMPVGNGPGVNGGQGQGQAPGFGGNGPQGKGQGGGSFGTGQAGPLRLFQTELSGQISWLLPFVAFACIGLLAGLSRKKILTAKQNETLFWLAWLLPGMAFFSVAGYFHQYYLIMLAPPIAALVGAGWVELWNQYRKQEGWKKWLLPSALMATTAFEIYILQPYQQQLGIGWSIGLGVAGIGLALVLFFAVKREKIRSFAATAGMLVLLVAPLYWSATPLLYGDNSVMPQAGPKQTGFGQGQPGINQQRFNQSQAGPNQQGLDQRSGMKQQQLTQGQNGPGSEINTKLLEYVTKGNTGEKYLFATTSANSASTYIIKTGKAVMAMGGFLGSDPILTVDKLKQMVANREVKYFLIPSDSGVGGGGGNGSVSSKVLEWIRANSTEVPKEKWQSNASQSGPTGMGNETLYQIKN